MNTQFCHADSRPKILVSKVSAPGKRKAGFHAGERVGREAGTLFDGDAHFVFPVKIVRRDRDQAELQRFLRAEQLALGSRWRRAMCWASPLKRVSRRLRRFTAGSRPKLKSSSAILGASPSSSGKRQHVAAIGGEHQLKQQVRQSRSPAR